MEIILLQRVEKLGQMGDVVRVKDGYARNYLLPQKKALRATKENLERFEGQRVQLEARDLEHRKEAEAVASKLDGLSVVMLRQASDSDQLYGSVNSRDIARAVREAGFDVERRQVQLAATIKTLGLHGVAISLHPEVMASVKVNVARSKEEAERQAKAGEAVTPAKEAAPEAAAAEAVERFFEGDALEEAEKEIAAAESAEPESPRPEAPEPGEAAAADRAQEEAEDQEEAKERKP